MVSFLKTHFGQHQTLGQMDWEEVGYVEDKNLQDKKQQFFLSVVFPWMFSLGRKYFSKMFSNYLKPMIREIYLHSFPFNSNF